MSVSDLSHYPKPSVVEEADFETILASDKARLASRDPTWNADIESDPSVKLLEVSAYNKLLMSQRINEAALSVMLPWSYGDNLDGLAAFFNIQRQLISPENTDAVPPIAAVYESDEELKKRCLLAWSAISTAGPRNSYIYHALSASSQVKDAYAYRLQGGDIALIVLSRVGKGVADQPLLDTVEAAVNQEEVRPLCANALVQSASIHEYQIAATLYIKDSALKNSIEAEALKNAQDYVNKQHKIRALVSASALDSALHVAGVDDVDLGGFASYQADKNTAPFCVSLQVVAELRVNHG